MAQLIKLQDYASRYTADPYRYPSRFIRLKQQNWKRMKQAWDKYKQDGPESMDMEMKEYMFNGDIPETELELKQYYLNGLLPFQFKWASRTLTEMSFLDRYYEKDSTLIYFLQRYPDTFLFMYEPIFKIKKAPVETDHLLIHPQGIYCISYMDLPDTDKLIAGDDRTWYQENDRIRSRMLSPLISLKRSSRIVRSILHAYEIDFPVKQIVLAPNHLISFEYEPYQTEYIGMEEYEDWFHKMRTYSSPLKSIQLKAVSALLSYTQITSVRRPEWEDDSMDSFMHD
ncbi:nuclease-related domain-containing protein [Pontibacillus yanchengensis]|uniref:NERD domain-containing protein n=1 Tax=Pontibacillus yanchengensis Y32 TaxID=1385514 RepID=A0A0A2TAY4_9BACI|nr:nuclease-related domain-containing protein [Pontibacillus yanchengensis]KGP71221.1 hypothetical protein N782_20650 [Pontibacillus yanchengensis Y32]